MRKNLRAHDRPRSRQCRQRSCWWFAFLSMLLSSHTIAKRASFVHNNRTTTQQRRQAARQTSQPRRQLSLSSPPPLSLAPLVSAPLSVLRCLLYKKGGSFTTRSAVFVMLSVVAQNQKPTSYSLYGEKNVEQMSSSFVAVLSSLPLSLSLSRARASLQTAI